MRKKAQKEKIMQVKLLISELNLFRNCPQTQKPLNKKQKRVNNGLIEKERAEENGSKLDWPYQLGFRRRNCNLSDVPKSQIPNGKPCMENRAREKLRINLPISPEW